MPESAKLLTIPKWAERVYGDDPPNIERIRRWIRGGKIHPKPEKQGREYRVREDAVYSDGCDLLQRIMEDEQAQERQHNAA